jgi:G3E family GTPase
MEQRFPVSIITGFLGSGKTTMLNRLLQNPAMAGAAVIINEFGEIGLDHLLITTPNENTVVLDSGCICCTVRGDLATTLVDLDRQAKRGEIPRYDRVLIETTGLADPVPIVQTVVIDERLASAHYLDSVVTLVDAVNGAAQLDSQPESRKQVAVADRLVLSKTDLADAAVTAALSERLNSLNPGAPVTVAVKGELDASLLFGAHLTPEARAADLDRWLNAQAYVQIEARRSALNSRKGSAHDDGIAAYAFFIDEPVTQSNLTSWLTALASLRGAQLLRVKGLLNVEGEPVAVHAAQTLIHEPVPLVAWPDDERRSRLVFITRGLSREDVAATLDILQWQSASRQPAGQSVDGKPLLNPEAYASFLAAMQKMH